MVKVEFLGPIGKAPMEMEAETLADVSCKLKEDSRSSTMVRQMCSSTE